MNQLKKQGTLTELGRFQSVPTWGMGAKVDVKSVDGTLRIEAFDYNSLQLKLHLQLHV